MKKQTSIDILVKEFSIIFENVNITATQGLLISDAIYKVRQMHELEITEAFEDGTKFYLYRRSRILKQNKQKIEK
jgi:hypothetical protein